MTKRKLAAAVFFAGISVTLTACGTSDSSHAVRKTNPPVTVASTSTTAPASTTSTGASSASTPSTTMPSSTFNTQTLDQVGAQLGAIDSSLTTANSDLNNPQGDS
jgi:hypothetical protein